MPVSLASSSAASMHGALVPIVTVNGSGSSAGITVSNIPQTYRDLFVVFSLTATTNNLSGASFAYSTNGGQTYLYGNGSSVASGRTTNSNYIYMAPAQPNGGNLSSTIPFVGIIHVLNYANTSTNKTFLARFGCDGNGSGGIEIAVASSATTSGITSFSFSTNNGSNYFTTSSNVTVYGVRSVGQ
jgi:hypothetical protein